jgi:hypothetical protein
MWKVISLRFSQDLGKKIIIPLICNGSKIHYFSLVQKNNWNLMCRYVFEIHHLPFDSSTANPIALRAYLQHCASIKHGKPSKSHCITSARLVLTESVCSPLVYYRILLHNIYVIYCQSIVGRVLFWMINRVRGKLPRNAYEHIPLPAQECSWLEKFAIDDTINHYLPIAHKSFRVRSLHRHADGFHTSRCVYVVSYISSPGRKRKVDVFECLVQFPWVVIIIGVR